MLDKRSVREIMLSRLRNQKEEESQKRSLKIQLKLFKLNFFKQARTVMFYLTHDGEVRTRQMIEEAVKLGKKVVVPTCDIKEKKIIPCLLTGLETHHFKKGAYCIDEPSCAHPVSEKEIDLVVVPGVAFDEKGRRIGRGFGYYDRFLATLPYDTPKVGLAFKFQVLPNLTHCLPHDISVDAVLFA